MEKITKMIHVSSSMTADAQREIKAIRTLVSDSFETKVTPILNMLTQVLLDNREMKHELASLKSCLDNVLMRSISHEMPCIESLEGVYSIEEGETVEQTRVVPDIPHFSY
jgi:hypothetical protein